MSCLNNVYIRREDLRTHTFSNVRVRCRECEDCKQALRSAAFVRMYYEYQECMKKHGMCFFFTLTFADEYVPFKFHRMCFDKRLVQKWLQKFRQEMRRKYGWSVKYFLVSELGHVGTHRPHHHGLFFFYPDTKYQLKSWKVGGKNRSKIPAFPQTYSHIIADYWIYGRCDIAPFDPNRGGLQYVAKYIAKDVEEDKLFKDIITRIQIKRGKGSVDVAKVISYYDKTFPSLFAFRQRYCPFTMISQGLGSSACITKDNLIKNDSICIDGFNYSIPRYYVDRYVRELCLKEISTYTSSDGCPPQFNSNVLESRIVSRPRHSEIGLPDDFYCYEKRVVVPNRFYKKFVKPSERVLKKYRVLDSSNNSSYVDVPFYVFRALRSGNKVLKDIPKQSEVNDIPLERSAYRIVHLIDEIETTYFNLPSILQSTCNFDIPKLIRDSREYLANENIECLFPTDLGVAIMSELTELSQVASEWRARKRTAERELQRKQKIAENSVYAKRPLTWSEYKCKSKYFNLFNH